MTERQVACRQHAYNRMIFRLGLLSLAALLIAGTAVAADQRFEITPFGGILLGGKVTVSEGDINIIDKPAYGVAFDFIVQPGIQVELFYKRQPTQLELETWRTGWKEDLFDMTVEYYHVGVLREVQPGQVRPFVTGSLGAVRFNPDKLGVGDEWLFSVGAGGGVKVMSYSQKVGFRLDARILAPLDFAGGAMFCGSGGGCSIGAAAYTTYIQFDLSGGLVLAF